MDPCSLSVPVRTSLPEGTSNDTNIKTKVLRRTAYDRWDTWVFLPADHGRAFRDSPKMSDEGAPRRTC